MISSAIYLLMSSSLTIMSFGQKGSAKTTNEQINSFNDTRSKCKPILYRQKKLDPKISIRLRALGYTRYINLISYNS